MTNIKVVDSIMGSGKTTAAIQMMNNSDLDEHFIYITPFLDEIERIKKASYRRFHDPKVHSRNGEVVFKLNAFHELLTDGKDIVSTHSLFKRANDETRELIAAGGYTLILDEVMDVIEEINMKKNDLQMLLDQKLIYVDDDSFIHWNETKTDYDTRYNDIKDMALNHSLIYFRDQIMVWNFPVDIFKSFKNVYILTYMFHAQLQRYYYELHHVDYETLGVQRKGTKYRFTDEALNDSDMRQKLKEKIHIYEGNLNAVGDRDNAFSKNWLRNKSGIYLKKVKNNIVNYFHNKLKSKSKDNMWTTFKDFKGKLSGCGYTKGFVACNSRATNNYIDKINLAYVINRYCNPMITGFFQEHGIKINDDTYAVSEMIQWIWRSAIRRGEEINLYIPSSRMRDLLKKWLDDKI